MWFLALRGPCARCCLGPLLCQTMIERFPNLTCAMKLAQLHYYTSPAKQTTVTSTAHIKLNIQSWATLVAELIKKKKKEKKENKENIISMFYVFCFCNHNLLKQTAPLAPIYLLSWVYQHTSPSQLFIRS